ncbi:MAG: HAMP domain-containing histidine kinase [Siculibacillus sp.]|nr:HAMP domain-containing histidine kinase [Siculibacillus sp.]
MSEPTPDIPPATTTGDAPATGREVRLSTKLIVLTAFFVMAAEILVFVPSIAHFRLARLMEMTQRAELVALSLENTPDVGRALQDRLLAQLDARAIAVRAGDVRRLVAMTEQPIRIDATADLGASEPFSPIADVLAMLAAGDGRTLRLVGAPRDDGSTVDLVLSETPIRDATLRYAGRLLATSAAVLMVAAVLIFLGLRRLFLEPLDRLSRAMAEFAADPENPARIIRPSGRLDEMGAAEVRLAELQKELAGSLAQKKHLADLGVAVSKINHDLRNMLASAQLITDRLSAIPDGTVQRFVPKLVATLDRAIGYSRAVLDYGRTGEAPPERRLIALRRLVEDVGDMLGRRETIEGCRLDGDIDFEIDVAANLEIDADPDQLFRVLLNLVRNATQAFEADTDPALVRRIAVRAARSGAVVTIRVVDTGPGVPDKARENLFRPFQGGFRRGGTGLGLAICAELVRAHGGSIELVDRGPGACFEVIIPDRVIDIASLDRRRTSRA